MAFETLGGIKIQDLILDEIKTPQDFLFIPERDISASTYQIMRDAVMFFSPDRVEGDILDFTEAASLMKTMFPANIDLDRLVKPQSDLLARGWKELQEDGIKESNSVYLYAKTLKDLKLLMPNLGDVDVRFLEKLKDEINSTYEFYILDFIFAYKLFDPGSNEDFSQNARILKRPDIDISNIAISRIAFPDEWKNLKPDDETMEKSIKRFKSFFSVNVSGSEEYYKGVLGAINAAFTMSVISAKEVKLENGELELVMPQRVELNVDSIPERRKF